MDALALKIKSVAQIFVSKMSALLIALLRNLAPILMAVSAQLEHNVHQQSVLQIYVYQHVKLLLFQLLILIHVIVLLIRNVCQAFA